MTKRWKRLRGDDDEPLSIIEYLDIKTYRIKRFGRFGRFEIHFNWRGFNICKVSSYGWYRVVCVRWWPPKIFSYAICGSTSWDK